MKQSVRKIGVVFLLVVISLAGLGVGYGLWSKTLTITGTVNTGNIDTVFMEQANDPHNTPPPDVPTPRTNDPTGLTPDPRRTCTWDGGKWVCGLQSSHPTNKLAATIAYVEPAALTQPGKTLTVNVSNGWWGLGGGYCPTVDYDVVNQGTVPVKIKAITIALPPPDAPDTRPPVHAWLTGIAIGDQLDPNIPRHGQLELCLTEASNLNKVYTVNATIETWNYNEAP